MRNTPVYKRFIFFIVICITLQQLSCKKDKPAQLHTVQTVSNALYADSILFINDAGSKNIVMPLSAAPGTFTSFPDGLKVDDNSGAIDVNSSETGLKFQVTFTPADGSKVKSTFIIISGINIRKVRFHKSYGILSIRKYIIKRQHFWMNTGSF